MAVSFNPGVNPEEYLKTYAADNNMSVKDARAALEAEHGKPNMGVSIFEDTDKANDEMNADSIMNINPNIIVQIYSETNGMSIDEAIAELEEKLGVPDQSNLSETVLNFIKNLIDVFSGKESAEDQPDPSIDPDTYAQQYADENGLTLEEAKEALKEKYSDPVKPEKEGNEDDVKKGEEASKPDPGVDPDTYAQQYADENGLTLEEAKEALKEKYDDPVKPEKEEGSSEKINFNRYEDPDVYVKRYAIEHHITYDEAKTHFETQYGAFK